MEPTTREHAERLRAAFKARGWSTRMVSVRTKAFGMSTAIDVTIYDPRVPRDEVAVLARTAEALRIDPYTGEVYSGLNRWVHVTYRPRTEEAK